MILTDAQIQKAIDDGHLIIEPKPATDQFSPTALDLRISGDIQRFKPELYATRGVNVQIDLDEIEIFNLKPHLEQVAVAGDGTVIIKPKELLVATTVERIELPPHGLLAARVEGRSRFARLGLVVHMTAPTIHNTFRGQITLEIMNHGPIPLVIRPNQTRLCQLIFERIAEEPEKELQSPFQNQNSPLGQSPL